MVKIKGAWFQSCKYECFYASTLDKGAFYTICIAFKAIKKVFEPFTGEIFVFIFSDNPGKNILNWAQKIDFLIYFANNFSKWK